jgi:hypothetical protein
MKMAIKLQSSVLLAGILLSSVGALALDNYKEFKRDTWDFQVGTNYFSSEANYDSGGKNQSLASGAKYTLLDLNFETRYIPRRDLSFFAMGNIGNSESDNTVAKRSNSTFNELMAGMDFVAYSGAFDLIPEFGLVVPFEKVDLNSDSSLNSEGVFQLWGRLIAQKEFTAHIRGYGWGGIQYRGEGRSFLLPWGLGMQFKLPRIRLGGELFGSQSISDDKDKGTGSELTRTAYINQVDAGSLKFYSINPSLIDTSLYATFLMTPKWSLQVNGGMTVAGANAAAGFHLGGFLRYSFDMAEGYAEKPFVSVESALPLERSNMYKPEDTSISSEKKVKKFKEDTNDGVSQEAFKARPTKAPKKKVVPPQETQDFPMQLKKTKKKSY